MQRRAIDPGELDLKNDKAMLRRMSPFVALNGLQGLSNDVSSSRQSEPRGLARRSLGSTTTCCISIQRRLRWKAAPVAST